MGELMLLVNLFGGSYRGSADSRSNLYYLNKSAHRDVIVWDFYNGIDETGLKKLIGRPGVDNVHFRRPFEPSAGTTVAMGTTRTRLDVHRWKWNGGLEPTTAYSEDTTYVADAAGAYDTLKIVFMAHGNYDSPSFENDAGSQVHPNVLISAIFHNLFKPFPAGLGLTGTLKGIVFSIQTCNSWLGEHSIKSTMVTLFRDARLAKFIRKLLPSKRDVYIAGVERVSYSIGRYGFPERNDKFNAQFITMIDRVAAASGVSKEILLRGGELSRDGRGYVRNTKAVELRSAALALLEGDLARPDEAVDGKPLTEQDKLKRKQTALLQDIDRTGIERFDTIGERITGKNEGTKHLLEISFGDAGIVVTDTAKYTGTVHKSETLSYKTDVLSRDELPDPNWLVATVPGKANADPYLVIGFKLQQAMAGVPRVRNGAHAGKLPSNYRAFLDELAAEQRKVLNRRAFMRSFVLQSTANALHASAIRLNLNSSVRAVVQQLKVNPASAIAAWTPAFELAQQQEQERAAAARIERAVAQRQILVAKRRARWKFG